MVATGLEAARALSLNDDTDYTVTGLAADFTDSGGGTLTVTTTDATDNAIAITTGAGDTSVTGNSGSAAAQDTVTVHADRSDERHAGTKCSRRVWASQP